MDDGKPQKFPYSYKTISIPVNSQFIFNKPRLEIINPVNIFETEFLICHIRIQFDASLATADKVLMNVMVTGLDASGFTVRAARGVTLNKAAVSNVVDAVVDLTPFLYKSGRNQINFEVPFQIAGGGLSGTNILQIWKADMAYTTKGLI